MKKVLIISYYWPPTGGSGVQRWLKFAKYLTRAGYEVTVYTPSNPSDVLRDESLLGDVPSSITVLTQPIFEPNNLYKKFLGKKSGSGNNVTYIHAGKKIWKERLGLWIRANLFIPDPKISWKRRSVRFLVKYLDSNPQDVLISTGPPHSMHLIAQAVVKRTGVKWIADFRDPWTGMYNFVSLPLSARALRRHRKLEKSVYETADEIIQVTPKYCNDIAAVVPQKAEHIHYISNGYDEDDYPAIRPALDENFTITVTGMFRVDNLYEDFLKALAEAAGRSEGFRSKYCLRLLGKVDKTIIEAIESLGLRYEYLGYRPHSEAIAAQLSAHILFLPMYKSSWDKGLPFPGRVFEYLASGRPILSVVQEGSDLEGLLRETGRGETFREGDVEGLVGAILREFVSSCEGLEEQSVSNEKVRAYSRAALTERLIQLF